MDRLLGQAPRPSAFYQQGGIPRITPTPPAAIGERATLGREAVEFEVPGTRRFYEQQGYSRQEADRLARIDAERATGGLPPSRFLAGGSLAAEARAAGRETFPGAAVPPTRQEYEIVRRQTSQRVGPQYYRGGSEQAYLGPVAQTEAFFLGSSGDRWKLGAFYRGVAPEDRNPPAFISPSAYRILTQGIDPQYRIPEEAVAELYDYDPVSGYYVLKPTQEALPPISGGYLGAYPGGGGGGGGGFPRISVGPSPGRRFAGGVGLVNWRI